MTTISGLHLVRTSCRPENIARVEEELASGWLLGRHLYWAGVRNCEGIAFKDFGEYMKYIQNSHPGDLFVLWPVRSLRGSGNLLADLGPHSSASDYRAAWRRITSFLENPGYEVIAASFEALGAPRSVLFTDLDGSEAADFLALWEAAERSKAEIYVAQLTLINDEAHRWLKAKRPNDKGEVPLRGSY